MHHQTVKVSFGKDDIREIVPTAWALKDDTTGMKHTVPVVEIPGYTVLGVLGKEYQFVAVRVAQ